MKEDLAARLADARKRTLTSLSGIRDWMGPKLDIVNPRLWELGHVAWFQEKWVLRRSGRPSIRPDADALYDSAAIPHGTRWDLPLPTLEATQDYAAEVLRRTRREARRGADPYYLRLALYHEDMHAEALLYTRQTLDDAAPFARREANAAPGAEGDAELEGGTFRMGAPRGRSPFVFDNEKWAHPVRLGRFRMARTAVTMEEFAEFVDAGGYRRDGFWSTAGRRWRKRVRAAGPLYWRRGTGGRWWMKSFGRWMPIRPRHPMIHVNAFEAEAFARWKGRRLPTEAEWEFAATAGGTRIFPWGDEPPGPRQANLDARSGGTADVGAFAAGDTPEGVRQLMGNVWEWCATAFLPYPGFRADPYREYSQPWFGTHRVLRGGCWCTRSRLIRGTWRNFYTPDRRDVWAGFRTCAAR